MQPLLLWTVVNDRYFIVSRLCVCNTVARFTCFLVINKVLPNHKIFTPVDGRAANNRPTSSTYHINSDHIRYLPTVNKE